MGVLKHLEFPNEADQGRMQPVGLSMRSKKLLTTWWSEGCVVGFHRRFSTPVTLPLPDLAASFVYASKCSSPGFIDGEY